MENHYDASNIQVLEGLEAVRKRPGMYIGTTGPRGLHHLVWEIVDNGIDEALAGFANMITVEILEGEVIRVSDNGRGIPVDIHPKTGKSALETIFTVLHAGGKFDGKSYKVSGGLHGVGASVVNALSEWLKVEVYKDGKEYQQVYHRGNPDSDITFIGDTDKTGSVITFKADDLIFTDEDSKKYDYEILRNRCQQLAFLNKGIRIVVSDKRTPDGLHNEYYYEGGIVEYVRFLNTNKENLHEEVIYVEDAVDNITVEVAMQYNSSYSQNIYSFTNNINTHEGGTHEEGFRLTLTRVLNKYANDNKLFKKDEGFTGDDVREGLTAIISVKHPNPQFEGQTKTKLGNSEVRAITSQIVSKALDKFLLEHPQDAKLIIEKAQLASRARIAAKKAREATRKTPLNSLDFASKLADCRCKQPERAELYLVEGDSAGGSAKQGRESEFQAILPLRGKVLNVEKARLDRALSNNEIISMIQAMGTGIGEEFDISKARYHKVVIMTDAEVDGAYIRFLLLTFFYRFMRGLIEAGYVYSACPPLYRIGSGKKIDYAYSDEELEVLKKQYPPKAPIQRYKGLGEMDPEQLWDTTMDPEQRTLLRVTLSDAMEADQIFSKLMGDEVDPRREFIQENAKYVVNLDI